MVSMELVIKDYAIGRWRPVWAVAWVHHAGEALGSGAAEAGGFDVDNVPSSNDDNSDSGEDPTPSFVPSQGALKRPHVD